MSAAARAFADEVAALPPPIAADPFGGPARALLHGFYDLVWLIAILVAAPWWSVRCLLDREFRSMAAARLTLGLGSADGAGGRRRILVHGVSVGEVLGARALVARLEGCEPGYEVVISTTTSTGAAVARRAYPGRQVVRFPLDLSFLVRRFLRRIDPACVVLVELEVWPNFLRTANRAGIPVAVVNGRITDKSFASYLVFRRLLPQFGRISLFCVQDDAYAGRFRELSREPSRILITGNIKADSLAVGRRRPSEELTRLLGAAPGQALWVAGSTHEPEERWVAEAWRAVAPTTRLVLVPRHPERAPAVLEALAQLGIDAQRLTALRAGSQAPDPARPAVVDTVGDLEGVYALADLVFVGGSLVPHGGQNMLEPAAQGRPVLYGPHVHNFVQEAALLEGAGAALRLTGVEELGPALGRLLADGEGRERMAAAGMRAVRAQQGATALTFEALARACLAPS